MLSFPEKLMLLALHDEKGSVIYSASTALPYGLAGSVLIELLFRGKITLAKKKVEVLDNSPTGNEWIDKVLELIDNSEKVKDVKYWIQKITRKDKDLKEQVIESLIGKGILRKEKHKILWVFPAMRYPLTNVAAEHEIRNRIHQVVLQQDNPTEEDIALLSLVKACDLLKEIFSREDRQRAKHRINEIIEDELIGRAVSSIVAEITTAVSAAVVAATVAASASN